MRIVEDNSVETQEELVRLLAETGFKVTQATISRDIKELQLVKAMGKHGRYQYKVPEEGSPGHGRERLARILRDCMVDVDYSENIVVVKTLAGTASAAGEALDRLAWPEVVGTVAGDNTVLVIVRPREAAEEMIERLGDFLP